MAKTKPSNRSRKQKRDKSILNKTTVPLPRSSIPSKETPSQLLNRVSELLQRSQPSEALPSAQKALAQLQSVPNKVAQLPAWNALAEIQLELGDASAAHESFLQAAAIDPNGSVPESEGGGADKFLWLAQLSEGGGLDSVRWFEKGIMSIKNDIRELEATAGVEEILSIAEKKGKLSRALCGVVEIYMTDLSWEEDAEARCESLITEALLVEPDSPETLQTLASVRISQLRIEDAKAALSRSIELWKNLPPHDPGVPDFAARISLSRLLIEVEMEQDALGVLERLIEEDDSSVEAWYLGGWCLFLLGEKYESNITQDVDDQAEIPIDRKTSWSAGRGWLQQSLKLCQVLEYEDERLREHALELVEKLNLELGEADGEDASDEGDEWEDEENDQEREAIASD